MNTYIYFIAKGSHPIKIGISDDPFHRLKDLQTAHHEHLYLLYTISCETRDDAFKLESSFHRWYKDVQIMNEWYDISVPQIADDIEALQILCKSTVAIVECPINYQRHSTLKSKVYEHLEHFPDDLALNVRDLAAKLEVGKTTVAEVIKDLKSRG